MDDFCKWLNEEITNVDKTDIAACYRLSFEAHFRLVTIHPWMDGNGRTTRLVMNMIQRQLGLVLSIVRKEDKGEYIQSLVDSRENDDSTIAQDMMLRHHISNLKRRVLQYQEGYGLMNDNVGVNVGVNNNSVGVKLTNTQRTIYELIQANQGITHSEMAKALSVTSKTAERATKALRDFGLLGREGSDKTGRWIILK